MELEMVGSFVITRKLVEDITIITPRHDENTEEIFTGESMSRVSRG